MQGDAVDGKQAAYWGAGGTQRWLTVAVDGPRTEVEKKASAFVN